MPSLNTPENLRRAAAAHPTITSTDLGLIEGHVRRGDLDRARKLLTDADRKQAEKDAVPVPRDLFKVTDALNDARLKIRVLEDRIAKLEARQPVAKATQPATKKQHTTGELMSMIQAYVDDPGQAGVLGSMLQSPDQVQRQRAEKYLTDAKLAYQARQARQEQGG